MNNKKENLIMEWTKKPKIKCEDCGKLIIYWESKLFNKLCDDCSDKFLDELERLLGTIKKR